VLGALQDSDAGVEMTNHMRNGIVHKNCFKGHDVVRWLLRWSIVRRRADGVALAQSLLKLGHLQEVDVSDGSAGAAQCFKDDEKLYRFVSLALIIEKACKMHTVWSALTSPHKSKQLLKKLPVLFVVCDSDSEPALNITSEQLALQHNLLNLHLQT